jgi:Flp pilus assembly protein TadG
VSAMTSGTPLTPATSATSVTSEAGPRRARDAGVSSVEVVFLAPLIVMMILLIVALGVMVNMRSEVAGAARDAARAGSLQGSGKDAERQARAAAVADLGSRCEGSAKVDSSYVPPVAAGGGGYYRVSVTCTVDMSGFGVFGAHQTFTKTFNAPIDPLQNFLPGDVPTATVPTATVPLPSSAPSPTNTQFTVPSWSSPTPQSTPSSKKSPPLPPTPTGPSTSKAGH